MDSPVSSRVALLPVLLAVACGSPDPTCSDRCDQDTSRLILSRSPASVIESEPHLAASPDGNTLVAVWTARTGSDWLDEGHIGYAFSTDAGATWSSPRDIGFPERERQVNVKVASDRDGNFWMVWLGRSFVEAPDAIVVAKAPAGSTAFEPPFEVTDPAAGLDYDLPAIWAHRGRVVAVYRQMEEAEDQCDEVAVAQSDGDGAWAQVVVSPCDPAENIKNITALCADELSERLWLVHVVGSGERLRLEARFSDDGGTTWPEANRIEVSAADEKVAFDPVFCAAEGNAMWTAYGTTQDALVPGIFAKLSSIRIAHVDGQGVIELRDALDPNDGLGMHPHLARDGNRTNHVIYLAGKHDLDPDGSLRWTQRSPDTPIDPARSRRVDGPFQFEQAWGGPGFLGDYFGVVATEGFLNAAYAVHSGEDVHVAFQRMELSKTAE
jgi:hypothetical protein